MELLAFSLAILSGVGHAVWNFLTKRAIDKQIFPHRLLAADLRRGGDDWVSVE
jgi:hypothetical protein